MKEEKEASTKNLRLIIVSVIVSIIILFISLNGFGSRDMGVGLLLFFASILFSVAFSSGMNTRKIINRFLVSMFVLHSLVIMLVIFSDSSPFLNRLLIFILFDLFIGALFFFANKLMCKKFKN